MINNLSFYNKDDLWKWGCRRSLEVEFVKNRFRNNLSTIWYLSSCGNVFPVGAILPQTVVVQNTRAVTMNGGQSQRSSTGHEGLSVFPRPVPSSCDITCFHVIRWSAANLESVHLKFRFNGICAVEQKMQSSVVWRGMQILPVELQSSSERTQDDWKEAVWHNNIW